MNVNEIHESSADGPTRFGLHSVEGFGKTTLAAFFPAPVFLASENGFPRDLPFRPRRFPHPETWKDVRSAVRSLIDDKHDRETLVFDTVDHMEPLLHRYLVQRDSGRESEMNKKGRELISIEDYGFGKGYIAAEEEFRGLIADLDMLQRKRRMHVVMLMHSAIRKVNNPNGADYDKFQPKMHERISRVCVEWCENVFFGFFEVVASALKDERKAKGASTGRRILGTRHNALYDAKNRMNLPETLILEQPEKLIPYLLGEHLAGQEPPTQRTRSVAPRTQSAPPKTEPAKTETKPETKPETTKTVSNEMVTPKEIGTQNVGNQSAEGSLGPKTVSNEKTLDQDLRTALNTPTEKTAEPAQGSIAQSEIARAVADAQERATKSGIITANNKPYGEAVERWISAAKGDPTKLQAVINRVDKDIAAFQQNTQASA